MTELFLTLSLLAPAPSLDEARWQNLKRTQKLLEEKVYNIPPEAVSPVTVQVDFPVTWKALGSDGRAYLFSGTLSGTLTLQEPEPVPLPSLITWIRSASGEVITSAKAGETITIEGAGLWQQGVTAVVQFPGPGRGAAVLSATPAKLVVRLPATAAAYTAPLQVWWRTSAGVVLRAEKLLTVLPAQAPPSKPGVESYHRPDGTRLFTTDLTTWGGIGAGQEFLIRGEGFGETTGNLSLSGWAAPVLFWSDEEVRTMAPPLAVTAKTPWGRVWYPIDVLLTTAGGAEWGRPWYEAPGTYHP